jgi:hypothetical protein
MENEYGILELKSPATIRRRMERSDLQAMILAKKDAREITSESDGK